jgi:hypothetical protein
MAVRNEPPANAPYRAVKNRRAFLPRRATIRHWTEYELTVSGAVAICFNKTARHVDENNDFTDGEIGGNRGCPDHKNRNCFWRRDKYTQRIHFI